MLLDYHMAGICSKRGGGKSITQKDESSMLVLCNMPYCDVFWGMKNVFLIFGLLAIQYQNHMSWNTGQSQATTWSISWNQKWTEKTSGYEPKAGDSWRRNMNTSFDHQNRRHRKHHKGFATEKKDPQSSEWWTIKQKRRGDVCPLLRKTRKPWVAINHQNKYSRKRRGYSCPLLRKKREHRESRSINTVNTLKSGEGTHAHCSKNMTTGSQNQYSEYKIGERTNVHYSGKRENEKKSQDQSSE